MATTHDYKLTFTYAAKSDDSNFWVSFFAPFDATTMVSRFTKADNFDDLDAIIDAAAPKAFAILADVANTGNAGNVPDNPTATGLSVSVRHTGPGRKPNGFTKRYGSSKIIRMDNKAAA